MSLIQSILITGPSGVGKSSFARSAIKHEGSGLIFAAPGSDELDSYYGLNYTGQGFDDFGAPYTGYKQLIEYANARLAEVMADKKAGLDPRYKVVVLDTISGAAKLTFNHTLAKYNRTEAPPAMSPDGASFYTYLRSRLEDLVGVVRAFKGYGCHVIVLTHIGEGEVGDTSVAKETENVKSKMYVPLVPGAFKLILPSLFSTVLAAGIARNKAGERVHYLQWKPDGKKLSKSRLGALDANDKIVVTENDSWSMIKGMIEQAAMKRLEVSP